MVELIDARKVPAYTQSFVAVSNARMQQEIFIMLKLVLWSMFYDSGLDFPVTKHRLIHTFLLLLLNSIGT